MTDLVVTGDRRNGTVTRRRCTLVNSAGSIRRTAASAMAANGTFTITYRYYPVYQSRAIKAEDSNPVFDGVA